MDVQQPDTLEAIAAERGLLLPAEAHAPIGAGVGLQVPVSRLSAADGASGLQRVGDDRTLRSRADQRTPAPASQSQPGTPAWLVDRYLSRMGDLSAHSRRLALSSAILFVTASLNPSAANACSCIAPLDSAVLELTDRSAVVFVGKVEQERPTEAMPHFRLLRVRPHVSLRGELRSYAVDVWGGSLEGSGDCGAPLATGWTYLVFAHPTDDGRLAAGRCSLTAPLLGYWVLLGFLAFSLVLTVAMVRAGWRLVRQRTGRSVFEKRRPRRAFGLWLPTAAMLACVAATLWWLAPRVLSDHMPVDPNLYPEPPGLGVAFFGAIAASLVGSFACLLQGVWTALRFSISSRVGRV